MTLRLSLAQINTTVGDLAGNRDKILAYLGQARSLGADVAVFPEMAITSYPAEDLLLKPDFVWNAMRTLDEIIPATCGITAIIGTLYADGDLYNAAAVVHDGQLIEIYRKQCLPNYGVFDEDRYFQSGRQQVVFARNEVRFGVSICEDIWYSDGPPEMQASLGGAELLINISCSPYHAGKGRARERMIATRAADNRAIVAYCNLVGGQDELVFDGQSLICGPQGEVIARGPQFEEALITADLDSRNVFRAKLHDPRQRKRGFEKNGFAQVVLTDLASVPSRDVIMTALIPPLEEIAEVYQALVLGTRDYVHKNGFRSVVLGLSGGIDSSLTAAIAVDALGPESVTGVAMPSQYSSLHSIEDAKQLANNLGIAFLTIPINTIFQCFTDSLETVFSGCSSDVAEENLQPRIRGTILMALSNKFGWLVLTTGNKSEVGVGYSTLYGDTAGGFAVLKDVPKTLVYQLTRYRNSIARTDLIPANVLEKPPSAELRFDQKDSDSLPEYVTLDPILQAYVEDSCSVADITARGFDEQVVRKVVRLVDSNEYKRRQSSPGVKITPRAFGKDWRLPITNSYSS